MRASEYVHYASSTAADTNHIAIFYNQLPGRNYLDNHLRNVHVVNAWELQAANGGTEMGSALAFSPEAFDELVVERGKERAELLRELIARLKAAPSNGDRQQFAELFSQAKKVLELSDLELSEMFDVSRPTIGRWERGEFAPHPLGRKPLFVQLAKIATEKLRIQR